jgi:hypothetical protein
VNSDPVIPEANSVAAERRLLVADMNLEQLLE